MPAHVDLHTHSTASDGALTPTGLVLSARDARLAAIALTDHDSVGGLAEACAAGAEHGVVVVPGLELSAEDESGVSVHVLGYFIDYTDTALRAYLDDLRSVRVVRAQRMVDALRRDGFTIHIDDVIARSRDGAVGRVHIAQALVAAGHVPDVRAAFETLIGRDGPYYVHKPVPGPEEVIARIRAAGGLAVLAHPAVSGAAHLAPRLVAAGLEGLEALHAEHSAEERATLSALAASLGLVVTGGSDFHGPHTSDARLGSAGVPLRVLDELIQRAGTRADTLVKAR